MVRDDQLDAREGQAGRRGVTERFVVPMKPGNAGGGKGPPGAQFRELTTTSGHLTTFGLFPEDKHVIDDAIRELSKP